MSRTYTESRGVVAGTWKELKVGMGGWVRAFVPGGAAVAYLRYVDRDGRLVLADLLVHAIQDRDAYMRAVKEENETSLLVQRPRESELNTDVLRAVPLGLIDAAVNTPALGAELRTHLNEPGPQLRVAAAVFARRVGLNHQGRPFPEDWRDAMLLSQIPDSGVRRPWFRNPVPAPGPPDRNKTAREKAEKLCRGLEVPSSKPFGDAFYESLAEAYLAMAEARSHKPNAEIADAVGVDVRRVAKWISEARKRGFLGQGRRGRVG